MGLFRQRRCCYEVRQTRMPAGKFFHIRSALNGLVLDVSGESAEPGTPVITWPVKDGAAPNQVWVEDHLAGCIRSELDIDLCLTINEENELVVDKYRDEEGQHWTPTGDRLQSRADHSRVLDIKGEQQEEGAAVCAWEWHGGDNQKWSFDYLEARPFKIVSAMHGKLLTQSGDKHKLKMYEDIGSDDQLWYEDKHGVIYCKANDLCMASKKGYGHKMQLDHFEAGVECMMWTKSGNKIINRVQPGLVLDIKGESESEGAKVIAYEYKDQDNQHWRYEYV